MPLDFPANPTNGQTYGNYLYDSSITAWRNVNTDTGVAALNTMGLRNVVPTSVSVSTGSATVNANGLVTFTNAANIVVNGVFTSTFTNYRMVSGFSQSVVSEVQYLRFTYGGTQNTANSYKMRGTKETGTTIYHWGLDGTLFYMGRGAGDSTWSYDIFGPQTTAQRARISGSGFGYDANETAFALSGSLDSFTSHDGVWIHTATGTMSGTVQFYGYTN